MTTMRYSSLDAEEKPADFYSNLRDTLLLAGWILMIMTATIGLVQGLQGLRNLL